MLAHGRLRRLLLCEGARLGAQPVLAGEDQVSAGLGRISHRAGDDAGRDRTRGLLGAVFGPATCGETSYAARLMHLLPDQMLLADRAFGGTDFLTAVAASGAQFLVRIKASRRPPVLTRLPDGSFLSVIGAVKVRIIDAGLTVTCADGSRIAGRYRLATTLLGPVADPAPALIALYHERWEIESAYFALRHTLLGGRVLRSGDRFGVEQELWALLTLYQALRMAMVEAAASRPGTDPDRACFTTAVQGARDQVILASNVLWEPADGPVAVIGRAILGDLLPARRHRVSIRKVKSPISRYHARPCDDDRPLTSQNITSLAIVVHEGQTVPPPRPTPEPPHPAEHEHEHQEQEQEPPEEVRPHLDRKEHVLALLRADPCRI
ncbi:transposase [Sphaerisporangium aureirubrum]|uniref:Transposase n=1 Tax=Sphaerisporangium aureirubrum TaxID=1544736 RepID=A0ABW1NHZ0_9ACTN